MPDPGPLESPEADPFGLFERWLGEARAAIGPERADAMTLATATSEGEPSARMVMLRGLDRRGFAFHTNYESRKGRELTENARAALVFHWWDEQHRQVTVMGTVQRLPREESEAYFRTRPVGHRLSAWASRQDRPIADRAELQRAFEAARVRFGDDPPLPEYWGGYLLQPDAFEFWESRDDRLHDRIRYVREGDGWRTERLSP